MNGEIFVLIRAILKYRKGKIVKRTGAKVIMKLAAGFSVPSSAFNPWESLLHLWISKHRKYSCLI